MDIVYWSGGSEKCPQLLSGLKVKPLQTGKNIARGSQTPDEKMRRGILMFGQDD